MDYRVRIFVDFWNFQLNWNERTQKAKCNWNLFPKVLIQEASAKLRAAGIDERLLLEEIRVYVSCDASSPKDANLRKWLDTFLDRQPGFRVFIKERHSYRKPVRCASCGEEIRSCPACAEPLKRASEKGMDTAIATDLFSLAWEKAYDIAILLSSDADFVPAIERLQEKGFKIINATWKGYGHKLAKMCWASFEIDEIHKLLEIEELITPNGSSQ
jgi:uncharacterized LabA/DUF88 family protein